MQIVLASMATGGYDLDFSDKIDEDLKCAVCFYVCKEPQQLTCCGKLLCQSCLKGWKQHSTKVSSLQMGYAAFPRRKEQVDTRYTHNEARAIILSLSPSLSLSLLSAVKHLQCDYISYAN